MMKRAPAIKITRLSALSLALLALAGCQAVGPNYTRPSNALPAQYALPDAQTSTTEMQRWWTLYEDAQLNALIEKAHTNNTNIQFAVARIEEADAMMREVGAALLPSVDLNGNAVRRRLTEAGLFPVFFQNPLNSYTFSLNSAIELDFWGRLRRAKEGARASYLGTQFAKETVRWSLSSLVANHYLTLRSLDSQLRVNQENLAICEASLALTKRRLEGGIVSILDVHQAELVRDNLLVQEAELQRLRALSQHQLAILTGELDLTIPAADILALPVPPLPPAGLPSSLLEARPDVRQAEQALVAANANIGIAKAALYPSISLTGALGGESLELGNIMTSAARVWSLGLAFNLPIFNAGRLDARVDQAVARDKQVLSDYTATLQTAFTEVNDALVSVRQYKAQEAIALSRQTTAQQMLNVAENRYKAGYSGYFEVLDAQRSHHEATLAFVQSRQQVLIATVALFKALGGGWQSAELLGKAPAQRDSMEAATITTP
jgi:outer membrane protein, multidrug efflux system